MTDPLGPLWVILVATGLRLGEALGLRWSDIRDGELVVGRSLRPIDRRVRELGAPRLQAVEPKTDESTRQMTLPGVAVDALERHRLVASSRPSSVAGYVFTTPRGTPLDPRNVSRAWSTFRDTASLPRIRIHDLRHSAASLLLAQGFTLEDVKRVLGHASIVQTSNTYGHLVRERQLQVAKGMDAALTGSG